MRKHVSIDPICLKMGLVPSVLEIYSRETNGFLVGRNGGSRMNVVSAYTLQTDNKKPTYVEHGNFSALRRVYGIMNVMDWKLVGGFHSHPDGPNKLSRDDKQYIGEKMEEKNLKEWLEMLFAVKKKEYVRERPTGWFLGYQDGKIRLNVMPDPFTGFDITVSGFWLRKNGSLPKIVQEATLWAPWKRING